VSVNPLFLLSGIGMIVVAIAAVMYWKKYSGIQWSFFFWGALAWIVGVTLKAGASIPTPAIMNQVRNILSPHFAEPVLWIYIGLLTGIFECGATLGFAYIQKIRKADWNQSVGFGVGFGAVEALLVGISSLLMVLVVIYIPDKLPPEFLKFITSGNSLWCIPAPIIERMITLPVHALSCVLILYAVQKQEWKWFYLSFAYKTVVDAIAGFIHTTYGLENLTTLSTWGMELVFLPFGIIGVLGLCAFRNKWTQLGIKTPLSAPKVKLLFWWMGSICLLLIIPIKAIRWVHLSVATTILIGIAPSLLGPAGLLFLTLSSSGRLSRLTLVQITLLVTAIALGLEFVQLIPRSGILARVHYTFDWLDIAASIFSVCVGYLVARLIANQKGNNHDAPR